MSHAKNKVQWCLSKAAKELQEGKNHRGLVKVDADLERAREYLAKSEHNLKATLYLQKGGFTDWCSSSIFYTIYHCFLAILAKFGYETRNQECTFALIASLIEDGKINITKEELEKVKQCTARRYPRAEATRLYAPRINRCIVNSKLALKSGALDPASFE